MLIGLGPQVNEAQMEELDDLDSGVAVDLWDHKLAAEMRMLQEIFAEVVDRNARVADNGKILDDKGRVVVDYSDVGLPAFLEFEMPAGSASFVLDVNGYKVQQSLTDRAPPPFVESAPKAAAPAAPPPSAPAPTSKAAPAPVAPPAAPTEPAEVAEAVDESEWKDLKLELRKEGDPVEDVDLDEAKE